MTDKIIIEAKAFYNGLGVSRDHETAFRLFLEAAKQGNAEAQYYVGLMYSLGQGVPTNYSEANKWLETSAKQGIEDARTKAEAIKRTIDYAANTNLTFLMSIDKIVSITEAGQFKTSVTGKIVFGTIGTGDPVEIITKGGKRVASEVVEVDISKDKALPGEYARLLIKGIKKGLDPQAILNAKAKVFYPKWCLVQLHLLSKEEGGQPTLIFDHDTLRFKLETIEATGRASLIRREWVEADRPENDLHAAVQFDESAVITPNMPLVVYKEDKKVARCTVLQVVKS